MVETVGEIYIHGGVMCKGNQMGKLMDCGTDGKINGLVTYGTPQTFPNTRIEKSTYSYIFSDLLICSRVGLLFHLPFLSSSEPKSLTAFSADLMADLVRASLSSILTYHHKSCTL